MFDVTPIYNIRSEIWVASSPQKIGGPKHQNCGAISDNFATIANTSGTQQDIVNRKTALQTTDTPAHTNLIGVLWCANGEK